jgi:hypothetical protein
MDASYHVRVHRLDAALADLRLEFPALPADAEVRGRLIGPRCPGVSTIEIAHHLRPLGGGVWQALIPEPALWTPDRPYVYEGPADVYHRGVKTTSISLAICLRAASREG